VRIAFIALLASGCVIGEESLGSGDDVDPDSGKIRPVPTNGLVLDADLAAQLPVTALGTRDADRAIVLAPAAAGTLAAPAGRALLEYVAICALPAEDELVAGGERFAGYYGLAPEWATEACGPACQRWVSACLLAHANADGDSFPISLRGDHASLRVDPAAAAAFTYQEAAYYGNVFQRQLYACWSDASTHASSNDAERFLSGRICGQIYGTCGLVATGPCAYPASPDFAACEQPAPEGGGFSDCHTGGLAELPRTSPVIREVITAYLKP
jgi:hypothetical protein